MANARTANSISAGDQDSFFRARWIIHMSDATSLHPNKADDPALPIDVGGIKVRQTRLRGPDVPGEPVECLSLGVVLAVHDQAMLLPGDGALFLEPYGRPLALRDQGPWEPIHVQAEV